MLDFSEECMAIIGRYLAHDCVRQGWRKMHSAIVSMMSGPNETSMHGDLRSCRTMNYLGIGMIIAACDKWKPNDVDGNARGHLGPPHSVPRGPKHTVNTSART